MKLKSAFAVAVLGAAAAASFACSSDKGSGSNGSTATFTFSGKLNSLTVAGGVRQQAGNVTHVMAVNPSSAQASRVVTAIGADGAFSLPVDGARPWILVFLDSAQTGASMIQGIFKANTLDSLVPGVATGSADLGEMSINGTTDEATLNSVSYDELLTRLGLSTDAATSIGASDDVSLRYTNPDIDGDGTIDSLQANRNFMLDFHVQYQMQDGSNAMIPVTSLFTDYPSATGTKFSYGGTGVYVAYPSTYTSQNNGTAVFQDDVTILNQSTPITAGTTISGSNITSGEFGGYKTFGVGVDESVELPDGTYTFAVDGKTLTFTNVRVQTLANITAGTGRIMPFVRFNKSDSACNAATTACAIASIDYKWMKKTGALSWEPATLEELKLLVNDQGGFISIVRGNVTGKKIMARIPSTSVEGTFTWNAASLMLEGVTEAELAATTSDMVCNLGLSYDDKLGMRYFSGYANQASCP